MSSELGAGTRELVEARIRALIADVAAGRDPDCRNHQAIAALYMELGMRAEAAGWLVRAAEYALATGDGRAAMQLAEAARALDAESARAVELLEQLRAASAES